MILKNIFFAFLLVTTSFARAEEPGIFAFNVSKKDLKDFCVGFGIGAGHGYVNKLLNESISSEYRKTEKDFLSSFKSASEHVLKGTSTLTLSLILADQFKSDNTSYTPILLGKGLGQICAESFSIQQEGYEEEHSQISFSLKFNLSTLFGLLSYWVSSKKIKNQVIQETNKYSLFLKEA